MHNTAPSMRSFPRHSSRDRGFTFIELLVVLIIVSILMLASIVVVRNLLIDSRLKAAAETFAQYVKSTHSEAGQRQRGHFIG